jgi:hypothetical protein
VVDATGAGSYLLTGSDVSLSLISGKFITADSGVYALTGTDVTLTYAVPKLLVADPGAYALTGTDLSLTIASTNKVITADPGAYLLTGTPVTLISSAQPVLPTRGEWPEKPRQKRQRQYETVTEAREALREALDRLFDGGDYNPPVEALEEAEATAVATIKVLSGRPEPNLLQVQAAENLIGSIQAMLRQRQLEEIRAAEDMDAAMQIARVHLIDAIDAADELYRRTRRDYLIKTLLLIAE